MRLEAIIGELSQTVRMQHEETQEWIKRLENERNRQPPRGPNMQRRERVQPRMERDKDDRDYGLGFGGEDDWNSEASYRRHGGRARECRNWEDNNLGSIKIKIPSFQSRFDPEAYLEWEKKIEFVFDCIIISKLRR